MNILVTDPIDDAGLAILRQAGCDLHYYPDSSKTDYHVILPIADAWIIRSGTTITGGDLEKATALRVIGRAGVGLDNIDLEAAARKGITVFNTPQANTVAVAEHVMGLILALLRRTIAGHNMIAKGQWGRHQLVGEECYGKTLGIIGVGRIGIALAKRAGAFGMTIAGHDPYLDDDAIREHNIQPVTMVTLLEKADIISLHIPRTPTTVNLVDAAFFSAMKPTAYLINCARGGVVNEEALIEALQNKTIAGAALDVFASEPPGNYERLANCPNLIFTPHLGASTREAKKRVSLDICTAVRDFLTQAETRTE